MSMILYGMRASPYVRKVLAYAAEKGIELEVVPAGLGRGGPEFEAASPFRKMPAFSHGDFLISDSSAIITYLDTLFPEPNLIPTEAKARAKTIWFEEFADTIMTGCGAKIFFNRVVAKLIGREGDESVAALAEKEELPPLYDYIESVIPDSGFLVEDRLTLADIAVCSPFVNLGYCCDAIDPARWPKTGAYVRSITARPAIAAVIEAERREMATREAV